LWVRRQICQNVDRADRGRETDAKGPGTAKIDIFSLGFIISVCRSSDSAEREGMATGKAPPATEQRLWHIIDADGQVLGRLLDRPRVFCKASTSPPGRRISTRRSRRHRQCGARETDRRKEEQKLYRYHSGYEGGLREERAKIVRQKDPVRLVEEAISGMLPKTKLGKAMYRKLKVYKSGDHPHTAQQPKKIEVA
jgi:large subunit ribosomal protein L13